MAYLSEHKLKEMIKVTRGASLSGQYFEEEGELIRLTLGNFDYINGGFKLNTSKDNLYYSGPIADNFIMNEGDIITPMTEQTPGLLGSTARIPESGKYIQSQDVGLVTCDEEMIDKDFCYYLLPSVIVKKQLAAGAQQTKIRHTSPDKIEACTVFIPKPNEQRKIGKLLSTIDKLIDLKREENALFESIARQIYDYWFVQFDFPNKDGKPYKLSGGKMVWNEKLKREIPNGWEDVPLSGIAKVENGATPSTEEEDNYGGDISWITPKDLSDKKNKFFSKGERSITKKGYDSCSTTLVPSGSILMSSRAPIGLVAIASGNVCTNQGFKNIVPQNMGDRFYLYYYIKTYMPFIEALGGGTTFKEVSKDSMLSFPILIVNDNKVYEQWISMAEKIFRKQESIEKEIDDLISLRDFLLPLLMNGQVTIKD